MIALFEEVVESKALVQKCS